MRCPLEADDDRSGSSKYVLCEKPHRFIIITKRIVNRRYGKRMLSFYNSNEIFESVHLIYCILVYA